VKSPSQMEKNNNLKSDADDSKSVPDTIRGTRRLYPFSDDQIPSQAIAGCGMYPASYRFPVHIRGLLIAIEGGDCTGKTTLLDLLIASLGGYLRTPLCFPNREGLLGELIDDYLLEKVELEAHCAHLVFSANRFAERQQIIKSLHDGKNIIVDRYVYSGIAYSAARGLPLDWCKSTEIGMPRPDIVIFLDADPKITAKRQLTRHEQSGGQERDENNQDFQKKVYEKYQLLMDERWEKIVTADRPLYYIFAEIRKLVLSAILTHKNNPKDLQFM
jgi:dTMP kinase